MKTAIASFVMLFFASTAADARNGEWQPVPLRRCLQDTHTIVNVSATPSAGGIEPDVLVSEGTKVTLFGVANRTTIDERCKPHLTILPFSWALSFQTGAQDLANVTAKLSQSSTVSPTFMADQVGNYVATLHAAARTSSVRIRVVPKGLVWVPIGPQGIATDASDNKAVGRVNVLLRGQVGLLAGSAQGGLHRYFNEKLGWVAISDHVGLPSMEINSIVETPEGIIVATGEGGGDRNGFEAKGLGLFRLAGNNWQPIGTGSCPVGSTLLTARATRLRMRITRPPLPGGVPAAWELIAATTDGLFRSVDGGACWTTLLNSVGTIWDVAFVPGSSAPALIAATSASGLVRIDGYRTATPTVGTPFSPFAGGSAVYGRIAVGKNVIYAIVAPTPANSAKLLSSTTGGISWLVNNAPCSRQCAWFPALAVDPRDDKVVYYGEVNPWVSTNSGNSFSSLGVISQVHDDEHDFVVDKDTNLLSVATDGGVYQLRLTAPGVADEWPGWIAFNQGLQTNQSATISISAQDPSATAMGSWDNGTQRRVSGLRWTSYNGGDGEGSALGVSANFAHENAWKGSRVSRQPNDVHVGTSAGFRSNPYALDQLWLFGNSDSGETKLSLSQDASTSSPPTWHCADPDSASTQGPYGITFAADGFIAASRWDGSVKRFKVTNIGNASATCAGGTSAATGVETVTGPTGTSSAAAVAFDPTGSNRIVVVTPGHPTAAARVRAYVRQVDGTWAATDMAGNLPANIADNLTNAIAIEPIAPMQNVTYVGTVRGIWQGATDSAGTTNWSRSATIADTWISDLSVANQTLRADTYGRGVWERRYFRRPCDNGACAVVVKPRTWCLACTVLSHAATESSNRESPVATLNIELAPDDALLQSDDIKIEALSQERRAPQVYGRVASLDRENGSVVVQLTFAGAPSAPFATRVTHLRLSDAQAKSQHTLPVDVVLRSESSRLLNLRAAEVGPDEVPREASFTILRVTGQHEDLGGGVYAVGTGSSVLVRVSPTLRGRRLQSFYPANRAITRFGPNTFLVKMNRDTVLTMAYGEQRD